MFSCDSWVGDESFCHFNSFVNVFMNAINTSFTLLCFWIPLGCGLCQFLSPRRQPHHTTFHSAVWLSTVKLNLPKARVSWHHAVAVVLMGTNDSFHSKGEPTFLWKARLYSSVWRQGGTESFLADTEQNHCRSRNAKNRGLQIRKASYCRHNRLLSSSPRLHGGLTRQQVREELWRRRSLPSRT